MRSISKRKEKKRKIMARTGRKGKKKKVTVEMVTMYGKLTCTTFQTVYFYGAYMLYLISRWYYSRNKHDAVLPHIQIQLWVDGNTTTNFWNLRNILACRSYNSSKALTKREFLFFFLGELSWIFILFRLHFRLVLLYLDWGQFAMYMELS